MADESDHPTRHLYEVRHSDELGRYLVAARDVEARTLIICEKPLVSGPADDDRNEELGELPMCLGCYKRMPSYCAQNRCTKCGWPVCGPDCEAVDHHAQNECELFSGHGISYPPPHAWPIINKSILVLRTLLLKDKCPEMWAKVISKLEHHTELRKKKTYCTKGDAMILKNLKYFLAKREDQFDEEVITRISGVINVNAFSTSKSGFQGNCARIVQCIYPEASLLAHSCIPNASWSVDIDGPVGETSTLSISIYAATPIKCGEMITIAYNLPETMSGTLHRLISTEDVAHFICQCRRCVDRTEMGTFVSAIKCFHCEKDYLLPEAPTDPESDWKCQLCGSTQTVPKIVFFLNQIEEAYEHIKEQQLTKEAEVKKLEIFLKLKGELLHQNHYILQEVRERIINLQVHSLQDSNEVELEKFIGHCKVMLAIADVLSPGFSKTRALLQFYLSQGLLQKVSIKQSNLTTDEEKNNEIQNEIEKLYKEIQFLETRALLFFNENQSHQNPASSKTSPLGATANHFASCIKRQLQSLEHYFRL